MNFVTHNQQEIPFVSSHLIGYVYTSYKNVRKAFGKRITGCDKAQAKWKILFEDGIAVTIYDYNESIPVSKVTEWHIGANTEKITPQEIVLRIGEILQTKNLKCIYDK